jgi:methylmalonyl-CoA/ethylmalonyl-CoA epimerase
VGTPRRPWRYHIDGRRTRGGFPVKALTMNLDLSHIGQIGMGVSDVDRSEQFYQTVLGLRKLFRFGDLSFFDCAGVRLLLEKAHDTTNVTNSSTIYLRCADIVFAVSELRGRGVVFDDEPHLIARMDDHDLWMAFFHDPDGYNLALMQEAPKGYTPHTAQ